MGGPRGDRACQRMLWVHSWGSASDTGPPHPGQSLDLASGSRETPRGTGIAQNRDGSKLQMKGYATFSIIRSAFADLLHCGGQGDCEGHL